MLDSESRIIFVIMRIGVLHREDVSNVTKLSGVPYHMVSSLRRHFPNLVFLGPDNSRLTQTIENVGKAINRLSVLLLGKRFITDHNRILLWRLSRVFQPRVDSSNCDLIFAPLASVELASIQPDVPVVYLSDITWAKIIDYYPATSNLSKWTQREGFQIETQAMQRADALIFPSKWAADSAVDEHGINPSRVHVIAYGANFAREDVPSLEEALKHSINGHVNLLWVGVNWKRKDGKLAFDCLTQLLAMGVSASLVICGCVPPTGFEHDRVHVVPFLDKNRPDQRKQLSDLYLQANFLLFPTLAEAVGVVTCEASAHGLPSLVRDTGGSGSVVAEGRNGFLMPYDADGAAYAAVIKRLSDAPEQYTALVRGSRQEYEQRLNWDSWGEAVKPIFEAACYSPSAIHE
jgi:glycosyltransferase involved in cell wall biosynthesis